ncbi:uncharacterized protein LOC113360297 [Papaver somniferum]|uniref:uncharacterized protein LOC113360297 n=1 Tax=Papaver somniferum TaxID=3469 RepID=UPI000E6FD4A9|nr:uncharacterized protein LOC113360297 [Papaver somniferum]
MEAKLKGWKEKVMPQSSRMVLIKVVLANVPTFQMGCFIIPKTITKKTNAIQRDFWWGKDTNSGGFYPKTLPSLCKPIHKGGLGFRYSHKFNLNMVDKLVWRLIKEKDSLSAKTLRNGYFKKKSPLKVKPSTRISWIWKCICEGLHLIRKYSIWEIGNGLSVNLWEDNWLPEVPQRAKVFTWKCLQNVTATNVNLYGEVDDIHPNCTLCGEDLETMEHLFFHCPYAREVWETAPNPISLQLDPSTSMLNLYKDWIHNPRHEISLELALTKMWMTWKERCNRVFESKNRSSTQLSQDIQRHLLFWTRKDTKQAKQRRHTSSRPIWMAPETNTHKINIDASWDSAITPSSFALILRDDVGIFEGGKAGSSFSTNPHEAEAVGVYQAAVWAKENNIGNFSIEGD